MAQEGEVVFAEISAEDVSVGILVLFDFGVVLEGKDGECGTVEPTDSALALGGKASVFDEVGTGYNAETLFFPKMNEILVFPDVNGGELGDEFEAAHPEGRHFAFDGVGRQNVGKVGHGDLFHVDVEALPTVAPCGETPYGGIG